MNPLKRFKSECNGSVAIMFAVAVLPVMVATGIAVDYSRAAARRTALQNSLDAAVRASVQHTGVNDDPADIENFVRTYMEKSSFGAVIDDIVVNLSGTVMNVTAEAKVPTAFMKLVNVNELTIKVSSRARWDASEVVLVLDQALSTARMTSLRTAVNAFIDQAGGSDGSVQIGVMPFGVNVRVPLSYWGYDWISFTGDGQSVQEQCTTTYPEGEDGEDGEDGVTTCVYLPISQGTWQGCIMDRATPLHTDDTFYNYQDSKKYPAIQLCRPDEANLRTVYPVGDHPWTALKAHVNTLAITTGGYSNTTIGVAWGHAMLSSIEPFQGKTASPTARKIIILVTSGINNRSRHSSSTATLNTTLLSACAAAKSAQIEIYTVRYSSSSTSDATIQSCASKPENFSIASAAGDIATALGNLANTIRAPQVTN